MSLASLGRILLLSLVCLSLVGIVQAAERPVLGPGGTNYVPRPGPRTIQVQPGDVNALLQCLVGTDVQVSNPALNAAAVAAGTFSNALTVIGIDQGIILSSGNIVTLVGPNIADDTSTDNSYPGDPDLDALIPGYVTHDAAILEFDFTCQQPIVLSFQYVFASEEYNEWVGSEFNDVFGFFLNGVNIAQVPSGCSDPGTPVAINNVNCQNPYNPPNGLNCDCYRNNDLNDGGGLIDTEMDGLTQVFYASAQIQPGTNHMKIAIADAGDFVYDSNVMIRCQSFSCIPPPQTGACCFGDDCFILSEDQCVSQGGVFAGQGVSCLPNPCAEAGIQGQGAEAPGLPHEFALLGNTPNPVRLATTIAFALPTASRVTLVVFDVAGRPVRTLVDGEEPAGTRRVTWGGTDARGNRMPAGVYFYRMTAGSFTQTRRMVLDR